jgi:hypothetical protein
MGVGKFFFLLNIALFLTNCILISTRFCLRPGSFMHSFTDQVESLFIPAFVRTIPPLLTDIAVPRLTTFIVCIVRSKTTQLISQQYANTSKFSIAIIMINTCEYGVPNTGVWLLRTMEVLFWVYVGISAIASAGMYLILWSTLYASSPSPFPPYTI